MSWGGSDSDSRRLKLGLIFLLVGSLLLVWAWGSWAFRTSAVNIPVPASADTVADGTNGTVAGSDSVKFLPRLLLWTMILVLATLFGSYALIRIARRYRAVTNRKLIAPTETESVWEKHKLP
jgi:hypothetical protein